MAINGWCITQVSLKVNTNNNINDLDIRISHGERVYFSFLRISDYRLYPLFIFRTTIKYYNKRNNKRIYVQ